jgi:hypothetical protein
MYNNRNHIILLIQGQFILNNKKINHNRNKINSSPNINQATITNL